MPCSSYLTSQSSYISNFNYYPQAQFPVWPEEWQRGFGRSPECTSYADVLRNEGKYTFSHCGSNDAVVQASQMLYTPDQVPPGVNRRMSEFYYQCCGNCTLDVSEVRLYYFRDETVSSGDCQANRTYSGFSTAILREKRALTTLASDSIAILSGYTLYGKYPIHRPLISMLTLHCSTSPSVYLEVVETAAVADMCGPLGAVITNPIIALPPGVLSTYSPRTSWTVGKEYRPPSGILLEDFYFFGYEKSLNVAELECPTFGVGLATSANGVVYQTFGPPYFPIIIPPREFLSLDPTWKKFCVDLRSYSPGLRSFAIFDPPRILTPVAALLPSATSVPARVLASRTLVPDPKKESHVQPAKTPPPSIPKETAFSLDPGDADSKVLQRPATHTANAVDPVRASSPEPVLTPHPPGQEQIGDPKKEPQNLGAIIFSAFGRGGASTGESVNQASTLPALPPKAHDFTAGGQKVTISGPSGFAVDGTTYSGRSAVTLPGGVISIIPPAEGENGGVGVDGIRLSGVPSNPHVLTVAGQSFAVNPSRIIIAGTTLLPGGPGITVSGTPISLAPSGALFFDKSPIRIANDPSSKPIFVLTIGGQTVTANPTGFALAGFKLLPGGAPITISGTLVSLNPSGTVVFGDSSIDLLTPTPTSKIFAVGGHTFTAEPNGFALMGSTLLPGGAAITVSGTPISLASSGALIIGSSSINLAGQQSALNVFTAGGLIFTAESSAVVVDGTTLLPGGPAVTISGTPISLKAGKDSGVLVIGTSSISLPPYSSTPKIFTVGSLTFTAQSSGVVIDGSTLVPGGPGATISGTSVSIHTGVSGLVVGSRRVPLATGASTTTEGKGETATALLFEGGQARSVGTLGAAGLLMGAVSVGIVLLNC
ncbi:hypothetical protein MMC22_003672 [Lobaria immixta]|nr:hypothetical protein [Lobaria immixta]